MCDKIAETLVVNRIQETGGTCEICEFAIQELDSMLEDKQNIEQIKEAMEAVCSYLPDSIASECKTFMDTYVDTIIDMITNDATPKEVSIYKVNSSILVKITKKNDNVNEPLYFDTFDIDMCRAWLVCIKCSKNRTTDIRSID